jgi:hypothetical protein
VSAPQGRAVAQGKDVASIELSGFDPNQLLMTTGRPLYRGQTMIGALFANYLMDDAFADRFKSTYMPSGVQVLFYTKEYGVYGNSFTAPDDRKLISTYITPHSDWIQKGKTDSLVKLNGVTYMIHNQVFPGLEESPGGALIFVPRYDMSVLVLLGVGFVTLLCFVYVALHMRRHKNSRYALRYIVLVCVSASSMLLLVQAGLLYFQKNNFDLTRNYVTLYNSTMRIQPDSGVYDMGVTQHMNVVVDAGDEDINAVDFTLTFDPQAIEVDDVTLSTSSCMYVLEQSVNQDEGSVKGSCVLSRNHDSTRSVSVAEVTLTPRARVQTNIVFDDAQTHVYAEDGLGTDVLRLTQGGAYRFDNFSEGGLMAPVIYSPTHPNRSRWYNRTDAYITWRGMPRDSFVYTYDTHPTTTPRLEKSTQKTSVRLRKISDGISYFHVMSLSGGPVNHYKIQTDTVPPEVLTVQASQILVSPGDVVRFEFTAHDSLSGMQRNFYVDLGNHLFLPVGSTLYIPFDEIGEHDIVVRAYDKAGNYTERSITITVTEK